jgi:hypothetical protein
MLIERQPFIAGHREYLILSVLMSLMPIDSGQVQCHQTSIDMKVKLFSTSCLAITHAGKLLRISKDELTDIGKVHLAIVLSGSSLGLLRPTVLIFEMGITSEFTNGIKTETCDAATDHEDAAEERE